MRHDQALQRAFVRHRAATRVLHGPCSGESIAVAAEAGDVVGHGSPQHLVDRLAVLHPSDQVDRLPCRTDLEAPAAAVRFVNGIIHRGTGGIRLRTVGSVVDAVQAESKHFAGTWFDGRNRHFEAGGIVRRNGFTRRVHGCRIRLHIHGGDDAQTAFLQQLVALGLGGTELLVLQNLTGHVIAEERRITGHLAAGIDILNIQHVFEGNALSLIMLLLADVPFLQHQVEHDIALILRLFQIAVFGGIVLRRVLCDGGDGRGLADGQFRRGGIEIPFRGAFHTIQIVVSELGDVQIALQNLILGVFLFHLHGDEHLTHFTRDGLLGGMVLGDGIAAFPRLHGQHVLHVLLGERGTALHAALLHEGLDEGAHHALDVNAMVLEESTILSGHHGLTHRLGDLLQRNDGTVVCIEFGYFRRAVGSVHHGLLRQGRHIKINAFDFQGRHHGFGRLVRQKNTRGEQRGHDYTAAQAQHYIGQQQREHATECQGVLFRHGAHTIGATVPLHRA